MSFVVQLKFRQAIASASCTEITVRFSAMSLCICIIFLLIIKERSDFVEIQENMAAVIHALKEKRGQSLTELSEELEISRSALQEYLAGNGNPTLATVEHLAERLGIPSVALVSGTLPSGQFDVLMTLLDSLKLLSGLSADQRRRFTELLGEMLTLWEGGEARER